jgi:hypothetical protein
MGKLSYDWTHQPSPPHGDGVHGRARRALTAVGTAAAQTADAAPLRILLLNPNSSPDFTRIIAAEARRVGSPGTEFVEASKAAMAPTMPSLPTFMPRPMPRFCRYAARTRSLRPAMIPAVGPPRNLCAIRTLVVRRRRKIPFSPALSAPIARHRGPGLQYQLSASHH